MANEDKEDKKEGEGEAVATKGKSKKTLFIILGAVLVVLIVGGGIAFLALKKDDSKDKQAEKVEIDLSVAGREERLEQEASEELSEGEEVLGAMVPLDSFVLNLKGGRYIKFELHIEFNERDIPKKYFQRAVLVRDGIITLVNNRTAEQVLDRESKEKLRKDIKDLINDVMRKDLVKQVFFAQFVVQ